MTEQSTTSENRNRGRDIIIFLVSTVICVFLLFNASEWFWVPLPFVLTYLGKSLNAL